jgi:hypothetical protein
MGLHPFLPHQCAFCVTILASDELTRLGLLRKYKYFQDLATRPSGEHSEFPHSDNEDLSGYGAGKFHLPLTPTKQPTFPLD